jgi:hypothetical protein
MCLVALAEAIYFFQFKLYVNVYVYRKISNYFGYLRMERPRFIATAALWSNRKSLTYLYYLHSLTPLTPETLPRPLAVDRGRGFFLYGFNDHSPSPPFRLRRMMNAES